jgi:hypothetical protein
MPISSLGEETDSAASMLAAMIKQKLYENKEPKQKNT